ncbi:MAG: hypothetical protein LUD84_06455 [Clostridiales bacterium]|nr:hypothetical protein [Clostridiales bacterium]
MDRPFITPDDLIAYTSYTVVFERDTTKLAADIARAEIFAMYYCNRDFSDVEEDTDEAESLTLAVTLLAEMCTYNAAVKVSAANSGSGGRAVKSESEKNYSYQFADIEESLLTLEDIGVLIILDSLKSGGHQFMKVTLL